MDEVELIQSATQGDLDSFNQLVLAYQELLITHAFHMLGERETAEDCTQEAIIAAYHHLANYRGGSFKAWLVRILTNKCIDELRRRKKSITVPIDGARTDGEEIDAAGWPIGPRISVEQAVELGEVKREIQSCLAYLPVEFREAVVLVDVLDFNYTEAALALGVPLGTLQSRLARGRLRFQAIWKARASREKAFASSPDYSLNH